MKLTLFQIDVDKLENILYNDVTLTSAAFVGTPAGRIQGDSDEGRIVHLYNCITVNNTNVICDANLADLYVGGVVGNADTSKIYDCDSNGTIVTNATANKLFTGGICGSVGNSTILGCVNESTVTTTQNKTAVWSYAGGIAGALQANNVINYTINSGNVALQTIHRVHQPVE